MKSAEEILTEIIRAINPTWNYGENSHDVYWQLHHFFDASVAKIYIERAMKAYASQAIDRCAEKMDDIEIPNCDDHTPYRGACVTCGLYDNPNVMPSEKVVKQSILNVKQELK